MVQLGKFVRKHHINMSHHSRLFNRRLFIFGASFLSCGITVIFSIVCFHQLRVSPSDSLSRMQEFQVNVSFNHFIIVLGLFHGTNNKTCKLNVNAIITTSFIVDVRLATRILSGLIFSLRRFERLLTVDYVTKLCTVSHELHKLAGLFWLLANQLCSHFVKGLRTTSHSDQLALQL